MTIRAEASLGSSGVESHPGAPDPGPPDGNEDEGPFFPWLPPEDRLWRHPSEALRTPSPVPYPDGGGSSDRPAPAATGMRLAAARTWSVALVAGMVGALAASGVGVASGWWDHQTTIVRSVPASNPAVSLDGAAAGPINWSAVEESVAASVVTVSVNGPAGPQQGSGLVIVTTDGPSAFVVTDRSLFTPDEAVGDTGNVTVTFFSGTQARGHLVGEDPLSGVALVEVADPARDVPAAAGSVAGVREADPVLAVGARTLDGGSLSTGSVSGEDRTVSLADGTDMDSLIAVTMPPMTPQATGGPLLDQYGRVVGITVHLDPVDTTDQAVTFAVPMDEVNRVATQLIEGQRVSHTWLGVTDSEDVPATVAHQLGLTGGVEVGSVSPGSPAGAAGVRAHDIITAFDGKPLTSTGSLVAALAGLDPGHKAALTYLHDGHTVSTTVRLADEPGDA